jgi:hypothetical protein
MPPKKKLDGGKIVNMYERMPKEFLDKVDNPNYDLHNLKIPFRICVDGPSGSYKTNFLVNLIHLFSCGERGTFQSITIITKNADEPLYKWMTSKCSQIIVKEGLNNTPELDDFDKEVNHLVVWDDLVLSKNLTAVENYYIRARKLNVSVIFISQSFYKIPKIIRNNCSYLVILKLSGNREVTMILSEFGLGVTKDQLLNIYSYATQEKFSPLVIDMEQEPTKRFRKGLKEIIDINSFPTHNKKIYSLDD